MTPAAEAVALDKETFARALRSTLEEQLTLDHPIFRELFTPERNWNLLKIITLEGYQITKYFLEYIENLYFLCPYPEHKRRLLYNLFEEETGRFSKTKNHVELMEDFIRAQGISDEERDAWTPSDATRELIDYRLENCKGEATYHIGAAAVMIASEGQSLETRAGDARHTILASCYGLTEEDTRFFSVHQKEDIGHVAEGIQLVSELCRTPQAQEEALFAVRHTCRLFWNMYESAAQKYYALGADAGAETSRLDA
ncbi:pyrroloquinoline quinone biosynthesis protein PqqC [Paraburkholderia sp. Ac-20336]|uniref:TenA family transcriptional regulator n=1 Tax=Paraburkholderia sp. Ac-20336 TaxID=2703886 RepID=UPI00197DD86E|nr:iron-containing redox enzyme family protein [Paraburkholderia sp. Ac-20336]MBN3804053.1 pyrroloquinoline quinone biosynthesis protein PqqC [Paraburkholderia sp. Ac-20336]